MQYNINKQPVTISLSSTTTITTTTPKPQKSSNFSSVRSTRLISLQCHYYDCEYIEDICFGRILSFGSRVISENYIFTSGIATSGNIFSTNTSELAL